MSTPIPQPSTANAQQVVASPLGQATQAPAGSGNINAQSHVQVDSGTKKRRILKQAYNFLLGTKQPSAGIPIDARHLASGNDYRVAIVAYLNNNPNLRHKDWKIPKTRPDFVSSSRVKVLTFDESSVVSGKPEDLATATALSDHFGKAAFPSSPKRRLYLLEGTNPEFVEIFGTNFDIDPAFFSNHQRTALWEQRQEGGNTAKLASLQAPHQTFFMEYSELLYFSESPSSDSIRNENDMRHINVARTPSISRDLDHVGIMHRKASFWSKKKGSVWNALILVDPELPFGDDSVTHLATEPQTRKLLVGNREEAKEELIKTCLYQGGYLDFVPFKKATAKRGSPLRISILDDMCYYFENHGDQITKAHNPFNHSAIMSTFFLQKIIASNYMVLIGYLDSNLNELETAIMHMEVREHKRNQTSKVEEKYNVLQSWSHRLHEYGGMVDDILTWHESAAFRLPKDAKKQWSGCTNDFREIQRRLNVVRNRTQLLNESFVGLASMAGMQESLDETKAVKLLTVLGFFFVPLSTIATIFAMPDHAPTKQGGFGRYATVGFSISGGLTLIITWILWRYTVYDWAKRFIAFIDQRWKKAA